jgi:hypothetical protein
MFRWRKIRTKIFSKLIPPYATPPKQKISNALVKIRATKKEAELIINFAKLAKQRAEQRKQYNAKGRFSEDAYNSFLIAETEKVLGKKRASDFFEMCNDPYF